MLQCLEIIDMKGHAKYEKKERYVNRDSVNRSVYSILCLMSTMSTFARAPQSAPAFNIHAQVRA